MQSEKIGSPAANLSLTIPVTSGFLEGYDVHLAQTSDHLLVSRVAGGSHLLPRSGHYSTGGGNWITLDFRGFIFWTYITLLAIHITLSSIGVLSFPNSGALRIHLCSMVLSVILLIAGFLFYGKLLRAQTVSVDTLT